MKGATILSKDPNLFDILAARFVKLGYTDHCDTGSTRIDFDDGSYLMLYDRTDEDHFELYELPVQAKLLGYRYAFAVECRSEVNFCAVFGSRSMDLDLMVCDTDGRLYKPKDLSSDTILL